MPDFTSILVARDGAIGIITLNRPQALNALNATILDELEQAFTSFEDDTNVRAIILTGSGEKAFAAGADIAELNTLANAVEGAEKARVGQRLTLRMEQMRLPIIMAINGFALGGGCELAMSGDIRIASENAKFGQPEVNLGLMPGYGGSQRTTRLVGRGMALYLCLTGDLIDAQEALRIGLVQRVVPLADLMNEATRIATTIASRAPLAVSATKRAINDGANGTLPEALEIEAKAFGELVTTKDFKEGTLAFLEKRKPNWTNT